VRSETLLAISASAVYAEHAVPTRHIIDCLPKLVGGPEAFTVCTTGATDVGTFWTNERLWLVGSDHNPRIRSDLLSHVFDEFYLKYMRANEKNSKELPK
jgi:hypothetical protein